MEDVILTLNDVSREIQKINAPLTRFQEDRLRGLIESSANMLAPINFQHWFEKLQQALGKWRLLAARVAEARARLQQAELELKTGKPAHLLKVIVCAVCWLVCLAGEFAFTYTTLPFILNIEEDNILGIALSALVVAMLTVLEWALARGLEEPYQEARNVLGPRRPLHWLGIGIMAAFLITLFAGNLYTVGLLASARQESIAFRDSLERMKNSVPAGMLANSSHPDVQSVAEPNRKVIDRAITVVSVAVVVDGSILFLVLVVDLENLYRRFRANRTAAAQRRRLPDLERVLGEAEAEAAARQHVWDQREERIAAIRESFHARCHFELDTRLAAVHIEPPIPDLERLVAKALAHAPAERLN